MSDEQSGVVETDEAPVAGAQSGVMILVRIAVMFVIVPVAVMLAALYLL